VYSAVPGSKSTLLTAGSPRKIDPLVIKALSASVQYALETTQRRRSAPGWVLDVYQVHRATQRAERREHARLFRSTGSLRAKLISRRVAAAAVSNGDPQLRHPHPTLTALQLDSAHAGSFPDFPFVLVSTTPGVSASDLNFYHPTWVHSWTRVSPRIRCPWA
jgi:hypothetical protein